MKFNLAISPCPNDTFMFDAIVNQKIDLEGLEFNTSYYDIEQLNQYALDSMFDITKLSFGAYVHLNHMYQLFDCGSALGKNCGPILICKRERTINNKLSIAIPGKYTTANMMLDIAFPSHTNRKEFIFSDIENAVLNDNMDAGLIIHESRFTYQKKGLLKLLDLGEFWESKTSLPIPLGGIAVKRSVKSAIKKRIQRVLKRSIIYALDHPNESLNFIKKYSQELDEQVIKSHINLYVNHYSVDLKDNGKDAINKLFTLLKKESMDIFL